MLNIFDFRTHKVLVFLYRFWQQNYYVKKVIIFLIINIIYSSFKGQLTQPQRALNNKLDCGCNKIAEPCYSHLFHSNTVNWADKTRGLNLLIWSPWDRKPAMQSLSWLKLHIRCFLLPQGFLNCFNLKSEVNTFW